MENSTPIEGEMIEAERTLPEARGDARGRCALAQEPGAAPILGADIDFSGTTAAARPATVLVVDDNEMMRNLLSRVLERAGYEVITAVDGQDGLERFCERRVQLVVTDVVMPRMDGIQLVHAIITRRPDARIIAVSGVDDRAMRMATELGIRAALRTPVTATELLTTVRRVLEAEN